MNEECNWCRKGDPDYAEDGLMFCDEDCAEAFWNEWGADDDYF